MPDLSYRIRRLKRKRLRPSDTEADTVIAFKAWARRFNSYMQGYVERQTDWRNAGGKGKFPETPPTLSSITNSIGPDPDEEAGNNYVDVPVIATLPLRDPRGKGQDFIYGFRNYISSNRGVHIVKVRPALGITNLVISEEEYMYVERIDYFGMIGTEEDNRSNKTYATNRSQEYKYTMVNLDPPPGQPESPHGSPHHWIRHFVRYYQRNDSTSDNWVTMELIDRIKFRNVDGRGKPWFVKLSNPGVSARIVGFDSEGSPIEQFTFPKPINDGDDIDTDPFRPGKATCNRTLIFNLGDRTDGGDGESNFDFCDPPWRFDAFQNLVNFHWTNIVQFNSGGGRYV